MNLKLIFAVTFVNVWLAGADVYMHSPRGSNNRLNEQRATRQTNNRVFDSQNNNRGGYNVGDRTAQAAGGNQGNQYQMKYFMGGENSGAGTGVSSLKVEWTNQHGCGGNEDDNPNKMNCHLVLQFINEPVASATPASKFAMKDGTTTQRQNYQQPQNNENRNQFFNRRNNQVQANRVYQEPLEWYDKCKVRDRNGGLFTADQNVNQDDATGTRQNPNGNRNGYECPEERDYYPYWHPTPWIDIGILAENASMCEYFQANSFNVKPLYECVENWPGRNDPKHYSEHNNKEDCEASTTGVWTPFHSFLEKATTFTTETTCNAANNAANAAKGITYKWGRPIFGDAPECLVSPPKPWCKAAPFSRDNHLGNGADLEDLSANWDIPYFPSGQEQRAVMRLRYNITTDDYDPYKTDSNNNTNYQTGVQSPVEQNPAVDVGASNVPLRLAINTAQYGRTFQDRSHMFILKPRAANGIPEAAKLENLNVRGKRGNIVQVYPAVEYDFFPTNLEISKDDLVHIQWTGSNTHNNKPPGGDGQTGDDGQGQGGTDRNNILGMNGRAENYPLTMEDSASIFNNVNRVYYQPLGTTKYVNKALTAENKQDIAVQMASSGYYHCIKGSDCAQNSVENKGQMNDLLNNAPASYEGMVMQLNAGTFNYTCTRNNNFSNRSQKGSLIVKP